MITSEITIRNGQLISSACDQCSDDPDASNPCQSDTFCDDTWTRFYPSREENGIQIANIHDSFADFYDPFINGLISEQCSNSSTIDVRLRHNKNDVPLSDLIIDSDNQEVKCKNADRSCQEFEIRFCCEWNDQDIEWISSPKEYEDLEGGGGGGINLSKDLHFHPFQTNYIAMEKLHDAVYFVSIGSP